jgi:hypothetical protein
LNPTVPHSLPLLENDGDENVVPEIDNDMNKAIDEFTSVLSESVKIRVADVPYLG